MSRVAILLGLMLLQACAPLRQTQLYQLTLPSYTTLNCCWQSQESIKIFNSERTIEILSVLERTDNHLTIVILDPLGHRLAIFRQDDSGLHTLAAPDDWDTRLSKHMLFAIYLDQLSASDWQFKHTGWTVDIKGQTRTLHYKDNIKLTINYDENRLGERRRHIHFAGQPLTLEIKTLSRTAL